MSVKMQKGTRFFVMAALLLLLAAGNASAHSSSSMMSQTAGTEIATPALGGYDPVAYFEEGRPVPGNGFHTATHKGATYLFANEEHQKLFAANPDNYAPQYGGYCAYGVAVGKKFFSDPHRWKIVGGKLYLNLDKNIQDKWHEDISGYIAKADSNWMDIEHKNPADL
ncbi:YHS domain-containing (seleno)protein [Nitrospina watsonii]|uniref:YHS domain protein n=1 Tax=Nitrospina watsonii TaxID=1323948 RepID=A0ABM9HHF6_9BACT|nr:YHS domain-containing (seleno)protein [Nitrospina watsonii]CAI2719475.1 YHS domain protein [Nitrospina watsonii]